MPLTGINGSTSVAPMRGWAPWCCLMSISSPAFLTDLNAASTTASGGPTKVITVRLVASPESTLSKATSGVPDISAAIWLITSALRPSLKLGTHSIIRFSILLYFKVFEPLCGVIIADNPYLSYLKTDMTPTTPREVTLAAATYIRMFFCRLRFLWDCSPNWYVVEEL